MPEVFFATLLLQDIKHGFPHKPTAVAVDDELKLLAVATKQGGIRV